MALFQKGQSGNPAGRPLGIKDRRAALRDALEGKGEELLNKAIEKALGGDTAVLLSLLSRLVPKLRPECSASVGVSPSFAPSDQARDIIAAALAGDISPSVANELVSAIANAVRVREADEVLERLERLEMSILGGTSFSSS